MDARSQLNDLRAEWEKCRNCELGVRRFATQGSFVFGEGNTGGVMFIGEGPGRTEEEEGRPFVGKSGELLRTILNGYKFTNYYITNVVACRACTQVTGEDGAPRFIKRRGQPDLPMFRDEVPLPTQMAACSARVLKEIYLVDPVIIVSLGVTASEFLLNRKVSITKERGQPDVCRVTGNIHRAVLTDKRKVWERKVKGEMVKPTEANQVNYIVIPTLHPAFVLRKLSDHGADSPWNLLAQDIKKAIQIYDFLKNDISPEQEKEFDHGEEDSSG
jgi:uracil-DNA glycosylase